VSRQRRGHGEGSIYRRPDGRWTATIDLGWQGGKRRRKFLYGKTRIEVVQKLAVALKAHRDGQVFGDERTTVEQFLRAWLRSVEPSVARELGSGTSSSSAVTPFLTSARCD
jgi:integrase